MTTLNALKIGEQSTIVSVEGDDAVAVRLMEMGLIEGTPIQMIGTAPLGDPVEYIVQGYRLSLRRTEAERVLIQQGQGRSP